MHVRRSLPLLLVFVSAFAPVGGSAANVDLTFASVSQLDVAATGEFAGNAAAQMRTQMDTDGSADDGPDGVVTQDEADAFEAQLRTLFAKAPSAAASTGTFTMDGRSPESATLTLFRLANATGEANSTLPIGFRVGVEIRFGNLTGDEHELLMVNAARDSASEGPSTGTLTAPPGFLIKDVKGLPSAARVSEDRRSIVFSATESDPGTTRIMFATSLEDASAAGPLLPALLLGLVVAVAVRRRF